MQLDSESSSTLHCSLSSYRVSNLGGLIIYVVFFSLFARSDINGSIWGLTGSIRWIDAHVSKINANASKYGSRTAADHEVYARWFCALYVYLSKWFGSVFLLQCIAHILSTVGYSQSICKARRTGDNRCFTLMRS